jgi:trans-aconitate methyltransferase
MDASTATKLIQEGVSDHSPQVWIDLGAGSGLFTRVLAAILPSGSSVLAIDKDAGPMKDIPNSVNGNSISTLQTDFTETLSLDPVDGILIANALHYVRDQEEFVQQLLSYLKKIGRIVIVEYDMDVGNSWVPFPVSFESLRRRFIPRVSAIEKIAETPSVFGRASIYSAVLIP